MFTNIYRPGRKGFKYENYLWQSETGDDIVMAETNRPIYNQAWVDQGIYRPYQIVSGTLEPATTPCFIDMDSDPDGVDNLTTEPFSDELKALTIDTCRWLEFTTAGGSSLTPTASGVDIHTTGTSRRAYIRNRGDRLNRYGDFLHRVTISASPGVADSGSSYWRGGLYIVMADGGPATNTFELAFARHNQSGVLRGILSRDGNAGTQWIEEETLATGVGVTDRVLEISRIGSTVYFKIDGITVRTTTETDAIATVLLQVFSGTVPTLFDMSFKDYETS